MESVRYTKLNNKTLTLLNSIKPKGTVLDVELTREILLNMLDADTKGIRLPMASTILRFKNPKIYQIIDQRAYRYLYGKDFTISAASKKNIDSQIILYIEYLKELKKQSSQRGWDFSKLDRRLYQLDKKHNSKIKIRH